ncbi:hypothetical protein DOTSEDRAFT_29068 [Dothistroma septosporum NZE10]|uniref:Uncharacterized protein n=1 Tax=Dothistroma septosporum (strain NZE10 / CBS 128990) TaxID=675120 RepID=M2Y0P6_DOTSN|nr:hypothetical protein DOTSEDRAFT_29068 [Dothistroma septosporum NZE10]
MASAVLMVKLFVPAIVSIMTYCGVERVIMILEVRMTDVLSQQSDYSITYYRNDHAGAMVNEWSASQDLKLEPESFPILPTWLRATECINVAGELATQQVKDTWTY